MENLGIKIDITYNFGDERILYLIKKIAEENSIKGFVEYKNNIITIVANSDKESLEKFIHTLGISLPYSIFMKDSNVSVFDEEIKEDGFKIKNRNINILPVNKSICPECSKELFDKNSRRYLYPFISCNYCGFQYAYTYTYPFKRENTYLKYFQLCKNCQEEFENKNSNKYNYPLINCPECFIPLFFKIKDTERLVFTPNDRENLFKALANLILKGEIIKIKTLNGYFKIGKSLKDKDFIVLITNPEKINEMVYINEKEFKVLASQEKPIVNLQIRESSDIFNYTGEYQLKFKLPDDPIFIILAQYLKEIGIDFAFVKEIDEEEFNKIEKGIDFDLPIINKQRDLEMFVAQGKILIKDGEKSILPVILRTNKNFNTLSIAKDYAAIYIGENEYLIDKKSRILENLENLNPNLENVNLLNSEYEYIPISYKNQKSFKDYEAAFYSVLAEHNMIDEPFIGIYLSMDNNSILAAKTKSKKIKPIIKLLPLKIYKDRKNSLRYVLEEIANLDEEGKRLISNYIKKFPFKFEDGETNYQESQNISDVLDLISFIIGINNDLNISKEMSIKNFESKALNFIEKRGLIIDFVILEKDNEFLLDWRKMIRSIISYKLADTPNEILAFSFFESLENFLQDKVNLIRRDLKIENVILAGNFFGLPVFTGKMLKHLHHYNVFMNERLPIDNINISFGGIFV
ncbi:carbamoyltransferase HypF [Venenivibrio stagnispumantis]|uniref:Hydrogenase maturation protein HypF n=1 Tax=Venenivibrio stagnispumantis TaxID=407998 RepID=A0AA45WMR4_9AQUI|nr:hypothetical protein [Venenivibrio stagnispumantis]MCW4573080.1 hypothetical protein [Venenivibrio stagnispumantis]SMP15194.1 hydrogenase maturation protein HypF [Venenivibrio stagnispumantis]